MTNLASFRRPPIVSATAMCLAVSAPLAGIMLTMDLHLLFALFGLLLLGLDVTVTAANVAKATDTVFYDGIAGATVVAGETVYEDSSDSKLKLADANASAATATVKGIAMHGSLLDQPLRIAIGGSLNPGFTVGVGSIYVQSANPGKIAPAADLAIGHRTTILGVGITASSLKLIMNNSGVAIP